MFSTTGYEWRSEMKSCNSLVLRSREYPIVFIPQRLWTIGSTQCFARFNFWLSLKTSRSVLSTISITITNMVSMERELNKLFNDTNYNKENVIIREIWSIKLELQNFFWGVYIILLSSTSKNIDCLCLGYLCQKGGKCSEIAKCALFKNHRIKSQNRCCITQNIYYFVFIICTTP